MDNMKDWLQNRANEIAEEKTGHDFDELGPQMQIMCYMKAEENYRDYIANKIDSAYEREKERRLLG